MKRYVITSIICCLTLVCGISSYAEQILVSDDFSGSTLNSMFVQSYPTPPPTQLALSGGAMNVPDGICWYIGGGRTYNPSSYVSGVSLRADMRFYPNSTPNHPEWAWLNSDNIEPFGFQNAIGGAGSVYAFFRLIDTDGDNKIDTVQFKTKTSGGDVTATNIPGYNPQTDTEMHNFRIDWMRDRIEAFLDGTLVATHVTTITEPLMVVGRNETACGAVIDNLAVASNVRWRLEAESTSFPKPSGSTVVSDTDALGGQSLLISGAGKAPRSDMTSIYLPSQTSTGVYRLNTRMKLLDAYDIGRAWRADVKVSNAVKKYGVAQGYYFKDGAVYKDFNVSFTLETANVSPVIDMYWGMDGWYAPCESSPKVYLDYIELTKTAPAPILAITQVWPTKLHYLRQESGSVTVSVKNTTAAAVEGRLKVDLLHDLAAAIPASNQILNWSGGETKNIAIPLSWSTFIGEDVDYGYEVAASTYIGDVKADSASEFFCVSDTPFKTATQTSSFTNENDPVDSTRYFFDNRWIRKLNESKVTDTTATQGALEARKDYVTCKEWYSWSPGGCMNMAPTEDFWVDGDTHLRVRGKLAIQRGVAQLASHGISSYSYNIPMCQSLLSDDLVQQHPDWFCVAGSTRDFTMYGYDMNVFANLRAYLAQHDLSTITTNNGYISPAVSPPIGNPAFLELNFAKQEVLDYVIQQMVDCVNMFGFVGVRWDCGHMNTGELWGQFRPYIDFYGNPLYTSTSQMVSQTVGNIQQFKNALRAVSPRFCFGTNFGAIDQTGLFPDMTQELCEDEGWLLDETSYTYGSATSPYRFWDKYYEVMSDQGNSIASMGGHYNPFSPTRFGSPYPADRIYSTVFALAGHGHPCVYFRNSCFVTGDTAQFAVRFGRYLFDIQLLRVESPESMVEVLGSKPLWWNKSVLRRTYATKEVLVVHLINPPVSTKLYEGTTSALPSPATNITVSAAIPEGKTIGSAWALTAESWRTGDPSRTQAVQLPVTINAGRVSVTIPEVILWKTVVFRFVDQSTTTIAAAKTSPEVSDVTMTGKVVATTFDGFFYVEESDRSAGIKVLGSAKAGDVVNVAGRVETIAGEKTITPEDLVKIGTGAIPAPLGMTNRTALQDAVTVGLHIRAWGKVESIAADGKSFTMGDGGPVPLKVYGVAAIGDMVSVTGALGAEESGESIIRVLRAKSVRTLD